MVQSHVGPYREDLLDGIASALAGLSDVPRAVIVLRAHGLAVSEIAGYLGIEFESVLNHIDQASAALANHTDIEATKREFGRRRDLLMMAEMLAEGR